MQVYDRLTGLYEKNYFLGHLEHEVARCGRYRRPLSLLVAEFQYDFFVTDQDVRWSMGYSLFRQLGPILLATLRTVDMACRFEVDTAMAFLPETGFEGAATAAERIRHRVELHEFLGREPEERVRVALNVGVAIYPQNGPGAGELIQAGREAVKQARERGGNLVLVAPSAGGEFPPVVRTEAPESWDGLAAQQAAAASGRPGESAPVREGGSPPGL